ncbi:unnamed protein product [Lepeophtheirus salmonis]|uniref:(salmon louse) hypothetical protein n=1 Tax=Lepeophtheirus salmonis TaxID=72036 RepID=A0A7R8D6Y6_LEPSM|nr:unnamed protein product [Lepeophtheirus salmonis]CAF3022451.1 unnamed protein product [Lepeophtheirus salmonis]
MASIKVFLILLTLTALFSQSNGQIKNTQSPDEETHAPPQYITMLNILIVLLLEIRTRGVQQKLISGTNETLFWEYCNSVCNVAATADPAACHTLENQQCVDNGGTLWCATTLNSDGEAVGWGQLIIQPLDNLNNGYHSRMAPNSNYRMNYHVIMGRYIPLAGIDFNAFALYDVNYSVCCKHLFPTKTSYEVHRIQAHKDGMFKCQVLYCCCTFNQKDLLHKHEAEHHAEEQWGPISCFVCFTILPHPEENEGYVKYHTLMHTSHS